MLSSHTKKETTMQKKYYIILDADNCTLPPKGVDLFVKSWAIPEAIPNKLIKMLADNLLNFASLPEKTEIIIASGSNRQSHALEICNALSNNNGIFCIFLKNLVEKLQKLYPKLTIQLDKFILQNLTDSNSFETILQTTNDYYLKLFEKQDLELIEKNKGGKKKRILNLVKSKKISGSELFPDPKKRIFVYIYLQKIAHENFYTEKEVYFLDDNEPILKTISKMAQEYPSLIPENINLNLYHYETNNIDLTPIDFFIKGEGHINPRYGLVLDDDDLTEIILKEFSQRCKRKNKNSPDPVLEELAKIHKDAIGRNCQVDTQPSSYFSFWEIPSSLKEESENKKVEYQMK
jgi:hypothetical protein